jgi:hypothetical protein
MSMKTHRHIGNRFCDGRGMNTNGNRSSTNRRLHLLGQTATMAGKRIAR